MGRPNELKARIARNVIFEFQELTEFEELVGKDNVSREIRSMIKKFLTQQKKGEASTDPLNLRRHLTHQDSSNNNNATLDIYLLSKHDIVKHIDEIDDIKTLVQIEEKGKVMHTVARNKKLERIPIERLKREMGSN